MGAKYCNVIDQRRESRFDQFRVRLTAWTMASFAVNRSMWLYFSRPERKSSASSLMNFWFSLLMKLCQLFFGKRPRI